MKIEYDQEHDLLYVWFSTPGRRAARTETLAPGVHVDFDAAGRLVGMEVVEATSTLGGSLQFEMSLKQPA
jgi:uncharacterized protein YuzE